MKRIVNSIIDLIKDNKNLLKRINLEDNEGNQFEFEVDKVIEIVGKYREAKKEQKTKTEILINHYGNPYITAMLCVEAIINNVELTIGIEDFCYGLNKAIIKIVQDVLKEYKISIEVDLKNNITITEIEQMNLDRVICLGNSNTYMLFRKNKSMEIKYIPLFNIILYYDSEDYDEIVEDIRRYAYNNFYEIEIFDENEEFEDVVYQINHSGDKYCTVILSKDKKKQEKFIIEINSKIICINENPFSKFELEIPKEVWSGDLA